MICGGSRLHLRGRSFCSAQLSSRSSFESGAASVGGLFHWHRYPITLTVILSQLKSGADVGPALAADRTGETRLKIAEPKIIGPAIPADRCRMRAVVVAAVDHDAARGTRCHTRHGTGSFRTGR